MPKFKVLLNRTALVSRWIRAESEEQVRQILDGEEGVPELEDAEYDWDEDGEDETVIKIIALDEDEDD